MHSNVNSMRQPPALQTSHTIPFDDAVEGPHPGDGSATLSARDASTSRGRVMPTQTFGATQTQDKYRAQSAQPHQREPGLVRTAGISDAGLQRRVSNRHHRQTSVIHGVQHSRDTSFNSPSTASPLSPECLASAVSATHDMASFRHGFVMVSDDSSTASTPASATLLHVPGLSIDSTIADDSSFGENAHGNGHIRRHTSASRPRKAGNHNTTHSNTRPELRTPAEYALHHLFNAFVAKADQKIAQCVADVDDQTPAEHLCGPGTDASFDQLIAALGHITREEPRTLVDSLMLWRKMKGDTSSRLRKQIHQLKVAHGPHGLPYAMPRRNTEPVHADNHLLEGNGDAEPPAISKLEALQYEYGVADRGATLSVYLVCRVLSSIFEQSSLPAITLDLADRLVDIVFGQLKDADPSQINSSSLRSANWRVYGQVLGPMSSLAFTSVTSKFIRELSLRQLEMARNAGSITVKEAELRIELLIYGMRHLRIKTTKAHWPEACDFLKAVGNLFVDAHGPRVKQAYCQVLERLLLPVAAELTLDRSVPKWKDFLDMMNSRLASMLPKLRHWNSGFPLSILLLCVSPTDTFSAQWTSTLMALSPKLKDRATRSLALQAICRLTWVYLYRIFELPAMKTRRIEEIIKLALPQGRKTHLSTDPAVAEPLIQLVRMIGSKYKDLCFRSIIFPLLNYDLFKSSKELRIEQMEPEKMVVGIRAFLAIIADLEAGDEGLPPFPSTFAITTTSELLPTSPTSIKPNLLTEPVADENETLSPRSRPVDVSRLDETSRKYYLQFCEILGKITILCDNTFGGQAALNEKFSGLTPKTPLAEAFSFSRKEDGSAVDQKHLYYDLLHVAIQALPRCSSDHVPLYPLINLLCTGSAHTQLNIAASSAESLKSIARQGHAQSVAIAFPRFIFSYDSKYSTMSDEGMLGPGHIERTLSLYVELLQIWIEELKLRTKTNLADARDRSGPEISRGVQLEMTHIHPHVDEIEAYGLFFLCSQSRRARTFAIRVLRLVTEFDQALGQDEPSRIIRLLEDESSTILDLHDDLLTVAEMSRIQKGKQKHAAQNTLIEICSSEVSYDATLWFKVFPNLIRLVFDTCPGAIALSRVIVCDRLLLMHRSIDDLGKTTRTSHVDAYEFEVTGRNVATPPEVLIDQWKLYLIMACVTLSSAGAQSQSQLANATHIRKTSKPAGNSIPEQLSSARSLFSAIIPLLAAGPDSIRNAVVLALGSINRRMYRTLLESLQYAVIMCNDEAKARIGAHQRTPSSPSRSHMTERLRTEVTHVYKLTSTFLRDPDIGMDDWILNNLVTYTRDLRIFLNDTEVQADWQFHRLRFHYCGLMEELFDGINRTRIPARWIPFESRKSSFTLMEEWCGYAGEQAPGSQHTIFTKPIQHLHPHEAGSRTNPNAAMEIEKKNLRLAALSAMASLCAGPITIVTDSKAILSFQLPRLLSWVEYIFASASDKMHAIGRRALKRLVAHNRAEVSILEYCVERCYRTGEPKALASYFDVVVSVLIEHADYPLPFWRVLGAVIFALGNEERDIRIKSARLLRTLDERHQKSSKLHDFDISISDKTPAVYRLAQFEYSKRLANAHPDLGFIVFSEFALHFKHVDADHQRNMVAAILPWIQTVELQLDPNGGPTALSYMLLSNMLEITIRSSGPLHNEVQALWQALATGPHAGNVQLILDFIIYLSLERREQNFAEYAKQIVVFLSATLAGSRVIEFFLLQLVPKNMVNEKKAMEPVAPERSNLPYVADLDDVLPAGTKQGNLSLGQVALIFLVDLIVAPVSIPIESAIKLIHVALIQWDHYTVSVQEQAREMLVHLMHELVTAKIEDEVLSPMKQQIEALVGAVRGDEPRVVWSYEANDGRYDESGASRVPPAMISLSKEVVAIFALAYDGFAELWAKEALHWASTCPVRHLACRSFQVFRCITVTLDSRMLADMLARLSNTISDEQTDYQTFSLEILTTLKKIIEELELDDLPRYPQLFWTTCACLSTIHEREFFEALGMLDLLLSRLDLNDPKTVKSLLHGKPHKWEGGFDGLEALVYNGLKSADSLDRTLSILHKLAAVSNNDLTGTSNRVLYNVLANMPRFMHEFDLPTRSLCAASCASRLAQVAGEQGFSVISQCLVALANNDFGTSREFLGHMIAAVRSSFFPEYDAPALIFLMGFLTNKITWFRLKTMEILCVLIPEVNMRDPQIACHGPDLISPLLRLLQTELCPQALNVMDHIMEVSGNPLERHHIRMSMASGSARAIRKEYERTQSLYGIPMPSGWSIPMPAVLSARTRHNVHAVFYTCGDSDNTREEPIATPEVEFRADDGYSESYFPAHRTATMKSTDTATDANMGDLVHKLDSLDDFFDDLETSDDAVEVPPPYTPQYLSGESHENGTHIYDKHTAPILHRSLARTASSLTFQDGLTESRPPTSHHRPTQPQLTMSPAAFTPSTQNATATIDDIGDPGPSLPSSSKKSALPPTLTTSAAIRPGLHARSITSPANNFPTTYPTAVPFVAPLLNNDYVLAEANDDTDYDDAMLSDSENSPFPPLGVSVSNPARGLSGPGPGVTNGSSPYTIPTSANDSSNSFSFGGMKRGMRRLTGGKSESHKEKERIREIARMRAISGGQSSLGHHNDSPRVPRVPLEYLNGNNMAGPSTSSGPGS